MTLDANSIKLHEKKLWNYFFLLFFRFVHLASPNNLKTEQTNKRFEHEIHVFSLLSHLRLGYCCCYSITALIFFALSSFARQCTYRSLQIYTKQERANEIIHQRKSSSSTNFRAGQRISIEHSPCICILPARESYKYARVFAPTYCVFLLCYYWLLFLFASFFFQSSAVALFFGNVLAFRRFSDICTLLFGFGIRIVISLPWGCCNRCVFVFVCLPFRFLNWVLFSIIILSLTYIRYVYMAPWCRKLPTHFGENTKMSRNGIR